MANHIYIVYKTTNLINNKFYIGVHRQDFHFPIIFDGYLGSGSVLKKAIKKYGEENFKRETLHVFYDSDEAYLKERELVDRELVEDESFYNLCGGGSGIGKFFYKCSEETKRKISDSKRGKKQSAEHKKKKSDSLRGKKRTKETRQQQSESAKIAIKEKRNGLFGKNNPFFGKKQKEVICPYCDHIGKAPNIYRYHFNNCKLKQVTNLG